MSDRLIRDELLDSDRWLELSRNTHRLAFMCLLFKVDAFGNMEAGDGTLWRCWRDPLGLPDRSINKSAVLEILSALADADLLRVYDIASKRYLHIPRTRFRLRYMKRVCPLSPWTTSEQKQILDKNSPGESQVRTRLAPHGVGVGVGVGVGDKPKPRSKDLVAVKASRLAENWRIPDEWVDLALLLRQDWTRPGVIRESITFRDFWIAKSGANATKMNWLATWRNWIRRAEKEPVR